MKFATVESIPCSYLEILVYQYTSVYMYEDSDKLHIECNIRFFANISSRTFPNIINCLRNFKKHHQWQSAHLLFALNVIKMHLQYKYVLSVGVKTHFSNAVLFHYRIDNVLHKNISYYVNYVFVLYIYLYQLRHFFQSQPIAV